MNMNKFAKPVSIIAKIAEIACWVGTALLLCAFVVSFFSQDLMSVFVSMPAEESTQIMGLTIENGLLNMSAIRILFAFTAIILSLSAMIARNISLISRSMTRTNEDGQYGSPFDKDNVRMVREIGIFSISTSIIELVCSWVLNLISGGAMEMSVSMTGIWMGLVVLFLSTIFSYGNELETEVKGLV